MSTRKESFNKISRPKLSAVFQRKRLFQLLDDCRKRQVTWVSSPAGAGKTTLVASYLDYRSLPSLWYQIDQRDADPATFFHYMSLAVEQIATQKGKSLPLFTPEYMAGLKQFALNYFEIMYQRLNPPMIFVIDNFQLISESVLPQLIVNGLSVIPPNFNVIIISRDNPPPVFSRMQANQNMGHIGWNQVRLTQEETEGIGRLQTRRGLTKEDIAYLHKATDGWTAGLMLMLIRANLENIDLKWIQYFTPQEIFDYLGKEIFEREAPEIQDFLLQTSLLPHMTANMSKALSGYNRAGHILAQLNRNNRFTERRFQKKLSYQFHPLFREFLLSRANEMYSKNELINLRKKAATLLLSEGDVEEATVLLRDAKDWDSLARLIMNHAQTLLSQGRNQLLLEWLEAMPKKMIAELPWLEYWMGVAFIPYNPVTAQGVLEKAFQGFRSNTEAAGLFLSCASLFEAIYCKKTELFSFDRWIKVLEELMTEFHQFPNEEIEGQVVANMILALVSRQMHRPNIGSWLERAHSLLSRSELLPLNIKVLLIAHTAAYYVHTGDYSKSAQLMSLLDPSVIYSQTKSINPIVSITFIHVSAFYYCNLGMHAKCIESVYQGIEISKRSGSSIINNIIVCYGIWSAIMHEEYATIRELYEQNVVSMANANMMDRAHIDFVRALEALSIGDLKQAVVHTSSILKANIGNQLGIIVTRLLLSCVMHTSGKHDAASLQLKKALHLAQLTHTRHYIFNALMLEARFALDRGLKKAGLVSLRKALSIGREIGAYHSIFNSHSAVARLFAVALENGIEEEYVTKYIRRCNLMPASLPMQLETWPWPLKIFTLGRFSLVKNEAPIQFSTKAQKKPLEMIKILIAQGGRNVDKTHISDALWPDADGDKAERAFSTTLHRLRRLLDNDQAVQIQDGKLSLNPLCCWVDSWAFERLLSQADESIKNNDKNKNVELTEKALATYKGEFLSADKESPWAVSQRERLRSKFLHAVNRLGDDLTATGQWEKAADYYRRSLDVDDLSEQTYQRLMQCLQELGRKSEARSIYRRCQNNLQAALGVRPSPETQAIYQSISG